MIYYKTNSEKSLKGYGTDKFCRWNIIEYPPIICQRVLWCLTDYPLEQLIEGTVLDDLLVTFARGLAY
jgi:hypothetical protein